MSVGMFRFGRLLFARITRTRKPNACMLCDGRISPGDAAYRPITNSADRGLRICKPCGRKREQL